MERRRIDRIDSKGDIREHVLREGDPGRTLCGLEVRGIMKQEPAGNRKCARCTRLVGAKS